MNIRNTELKDLDIISFVNLEENLQNFDYVYRTENVYIYDHLGFKVFHNRFTINMTLDS